MKKTKLKLSEVKVETSTKKKWVSKATLMGLALAGSMALASCSDSAECSDSDSFDPYNQGTTCQDTD